MFGAEVRHRNPALAFLSDDEAHHRFAFVNLAVLQPEGSDVDRTGTIGVDHLACTSGSLSAQFDNCADPDGHQLELQFDCHAYADAYAEQANAFMEGRLFAINPIGVEFDPNDWLRRLRSVEAPGHLLERAVHLRVSPVSPVGRCGMPVPRRPIP